MLVYYMCIYYIFLHKNNNFLTTKFDQNIHQDAPSYIIFKKMFKPSWSDIQIYKSKKKLVPPAKSWRRPRSM